MSFVFFFLEVNENVTCCTVADSAGAVLAAVTVTFTFVSARK